MSRDLKWNDRAYKYKVKKKVLKKKVLILEIRKSMSVPFPETPREKNRLAKSFRDKHRFGKIGRKL